MCLERYLQSWLHEGGWLWGWGRRGPGQKAAVGVSSLLAWLCVPGDLGILSELWLRPRREGWTGRGRAVSKHPTSRLGPALQSGCGLLCSVRHMNGSQLRLLPAGQARAGQSISLNLGFILCTMGKISSVLGCRWMR